MRMNISVPDELAEQVRARDLPISAICQRALSAAVRDDEQRAMLGGDLDEVAERLRGTVDATFKAKFANGRDDGIAWAKHYATVDDLTRLASEGVAALGPASPSLVEFVSATRGQRVTSVDIVVSAYWDGFAAGAVEVWKVVHRLM